MEPIEDTTLDSGFTKPNKIPDNYELKTPALLRRTPTIDDQSRSQEREDSPPHKPSASETTPIGRVSPSRRGSFPSEPQRRESLPAQRDVRRDSGPGASPTRKDSAPSQSPTTRRESVPESQRRESVPEGHRRESVPRTSPGRKDSAPTQSPTRRESIPQETEDVKPTKFGVLLRKTSSKMFNRRVSEDVGKKETEIERIFDVDLLEEMVSTYLCVDI